MNFKQIIATYWASPSGFIGLVYVICTNRFGMTIDPHLYLKAGLWAIIPISLPLSVHEFYKTYKNRK